MKRIIIKLYNVKGGAIDTIMFLLRNPIIENIQTKERFNKFYDIQSL